MPKAELLHTSSAFSCIDVANTVLVMAVKTQIVKFKEVFSLNSDSLVSLQIINYILLLN